MSIKVKSKVGRLRTIDRNLVVSKYKELGKILLVAKDLGINEKSVRNILKERNIPTTPRNKRARKYTVQDDFFESIDSAKKAYVLGFICADGHINNEKTNYQLVIGLATADEYQLEIIKSAMNSNHPIYRRDRPPVRPGGKTTKASSISIGRKKIVKDLVKLGLTPNKTWNLKIPPIDINLFFHWLRGFIDGDGHVRYDKAGRGIVNIISTIDISNAIISKLSFFNIEARQRIANNYTQPLARTLITRKDEIIKLRELLYENCEDFYMARKKKEFYKIKYRGPAVRTGKENPFFGKTHSEETKNIIKIKNQGENNHNNKLTTNDVKQIKLMAESVKTKKIAEKFNVSPGTIRSIKNGKTWGHIKVSDE